MARLALLLLIAALGGGCALVRVPAAIVQGTAGAASSVAKAAFFSKKPADASNAAVANNASASQTQLATTSTSSRDRPFQERISRPDLSMAYLPAQKGFTPSGNLAQMKKVPTRDFVSDRRTPVKEFATADANGGRRAVSVKDFQTKPDAAASRSVAGADRSFATRDVRTRELPGSDRTASGANKSASQGGKLFAGKGKRQDGLDRDYAQGKPMSVDDVRQLLNKGPKPAADPAPGTPAGR